MSQLHIKMQEYDEGVREGVPGNLETVLGKISQTLFNLLGDPTRYECVGGKIEGRLLNCCTSSCQEVHSLCSPVDQRCQFMQTVSLSEWLLTQLECPSSSSSSALTNLLSLSTNLTLLAIATGREDLSLTLFSSLSESVTDVCLYLIIPVDLSYEVHRLAHDSQFWLTQHLNLFLLAGCSESFSTQDAITLAHSLCLLLAQMAAHQHTLPVLKVSGC